MSDSHAVLCVDDEQNILNALKRLLRKEDFHLLTATSGSEGLAVLAEHPVQLVICDQRMAEMSGTEFLARVNDLYPDVIRITLSGYTEVDTIMESINKGHIYKFLLKPWNDQNLKLEIRQALEQYDLIQANRALNQKVLEQNDELKRINENLEDLVRARTEQLELQNQALELSRTVLDDLPSPNVGVGSDGMVVLVNKAALALWRDMPGFSVGSPMDKLFTDEICRCITEVGATQVAKQLPLVTIGQVTRPVIVIPLSGRFQGKGVVVSFPIQLSDDA